MDYSSKILMSAIVASMAITVGAQVTTSSMSGKIVDEAKEPVVGATVTAVHLPSGTLYGAITNHDGRYTIQGMRTGGPYKVEVSYVGYQKVTYQDIRLELGNTFVANADLKPATELLSEVTVVASAKKSLGSGNFSSSTIQNTPSISRNVYDVVKNMPLASTPKSGGISFAGSNNRYNSFQIDGTVSNDVFGLSASGTNGGQTGASPISMDAIEEIQVVVAPFDVRQGGFTGGGINAITKQGTNKFRGSVYGYYTNQNMYGRHNAELDAKQKLSKQSTKTYGASLGGAFIQNKLFYFVNLEKKDRSYPTTIYPGYNGNSYLTEAMAQRVLDTYKRYTGITDAFGTRDVETEALNLMARIDWNINDKHKFAFRYQFNDSFDDKYAVGTKSYTFLNSSYRQKNKTHSFVAELHSKLSESLHNELRASVTTVRDKRVPGYLGPNVSISSGSETNDVSISIGTDYSSGANALNQNSYMIEDNLSLYKGNHTFTFGTHNEYYAMRNLFIQASQGAWYYNSLTNFENDVPYEFRYRYSPLGRADIQDSPLMKFAQLGFYAQDKWDITPHLNLTYGLRFDIPIAVNSPQVNQVFNSYANTNELGVQVGDMPKTRIMVSPRIGVRWYTDETHNTLIRGGVGLFTGRAPFVWLSNAYTNNDITVAGTTMNSRNTTVPTMGTYANDPMSAITAAGTYKSDIVTVAKDFKFPQVLRASLALEQRLPADMKLTLEAIYSKTLNNVLFENLALKNKGLVYSVEGVTASAAPYYSVDAGAYNSIINLKNTKKGYSAVFTALLEKRFNFGLDMSAAYTYSRAKSLFDGTSSVASSNWGYNYSVDSNADNEVGFSRFDIPHRVMFQVGFTTPKYFKGLMQTNISLIYNGFNGGRYSLTYYDRADFNGDGWRSNTLMYIPTQNDIAKMQFTDIMKSGVVVTDVATQKQQLEEWIQGDSYAREHRGQYAERNSNLTPWENEINLHIAQDIFYLKSRGSKVQITFDIENFANFLNKKWGATYSNVYSLSPLTVTAVAANASGAYIPTYQFVQSNSMIKKADIGSRWHAQLGVKVTF